MWAWTGAWWGAYGQDDRVCAYTALMAETEDKGPGHTTLTILADKEEIGSPETLASIPISCSISLKTCARQPAQI